MTKIQGSARVKRETDAMTRERGLRPIIVIITSAGLDGDGLFDTKTCGYKFAVDAAKSGVRLHKATS